MVRILRRAAKSSSSAAGGASVEMDEEHMRFLHRHASSEFTSGSAHHLSKSSRSTARGFEYIRNGPVVVELERQDTGKKTAGKLRTKAKSSGEKQQVAAGKGSKAVVTSGMEARDRIPAQSLLRQLAVGNLTRLDLSSRPLKMTDVRTLGRALALNTVCKVVELRGCELECPHVQAFAKFARSNRSLVVLDLSFNYIADTGVVTLAQHFRHNRSLRRLTLINNAITDEGLKDLTMALRDNTAITTVSLAENLVEDTRGFDELEAILQRNRSRLVESYVVRMIGSCWAFVTFELIKFEVSKF